MITHLNTVTVYVSDQQKALAFYVDKLGFAKRAERDMGPAGRWLEVAPEGAQTGLVLAQAAAFDKQDRVGDSADLVFAADDVLAVHKLLVGRGVSVTEPDAQAWGTSMKVTDPDGFTILIMQRR